MEESEVFSYDFNLLTFSSIIFIFELFSSRLCPPTQFWAGLQLLGRCYCILYSLLLESCDVREPRDSQHLHTRRLHVQTVSFTLCRNFTFSIIACAQGLQKFLGLTGTRLGWIDIFRIPYSSWEGCLAVVYSLSLFSWVLLIIYSVSISRCLASILRAQDSKQFWRSMSSLSLLSIYLSLIQLQLSGQLGTNYGAETCGFSWMKGGEECFWYYIVAFNCKFSFCSKIFQIYSASSTFLSEFSEYYRLIRELLSRCCSSLLYYWRQRLVLSTFQSSPLSFLCYSYCSSQSLCNFYNYFCFFQITYYIFIKFADNYLTNSSFFFIFYLTVCNYSSFLRQCYYKFKFFQEY